MGVLAYNPVHGDYNTVYPRSEPYDLAELAHALPAHWRRPSKPADLATAPGRNCALFAALCKLALGGSDDGLLTWARTLNREFSVPLSDAEVRGIWRSVVPLPGTMAHPRASAGVSIPADSTRAQGRYRVRRGAASRDTARV